MPAHISRCINSLIKDCCFESCSRKYYESQPIMNKKYFWRHRLNIYELFSRVQWQGRKLCGFQKLHCQRGPDFSRAKLVILSHADWFECIWMTVFTSPGTGSCLCGQLASELHFKESPIFIALTLEDSHLYAALTFSFPCCNWRTEINKVFLHWHTINCNTWLSCGKTISQKLLAAKV